jgi:transposase InsO family protein
LPVPFEKIVSLFKVIPSTRKEAELAVFDYIETIYNSKRRHSSLGQISPVAFEQKYEKLKIKIA